MGYKISKVRGEGNTRWDLMRKVRGEDFSTTEFPMGPSQNISKPTIPGSRGMEYIIRKLRGEEYQCDRICKVRGRPQRDRR